MRFVCENFATAPNHCSPPSPSAQQGAFTCAYHAAQVNPFKLSEVYGAVAYPIGGCDGTITNYPNTSMETDRAISLASHELFESVSDPFGNGWCDDTGYNGFGPFQFCGKGEIGDKCNSAYGPADPQSGDIILNGHNYLVQEEWSNRAPLSATELDVNGNPSPAANKCSMY
jgi:hypothetical protein